VYFSILDLRLQAGDRSNRTSASLLSRIMSLATKRFARMDTGIALIANSISRRIDSANLDWHSMPREPKQAKGCIEGDEAIV